MMNSTEPTEQQEKSQNTVHTSTIMHMVKTNS